MSVPLLITSTEERARPWPGAGAVLALDLGNNTGWAIKRLDGRVASHMADFTPEKGDNGGYRYLRFRRWLTDTKNKVGGVEAIYYERIDFISTVENARVKFGFEATLTAWCEHYRIPYEGIPPGTIKKGITCDGNAKKPEVMAALEGLGYRPVDHNAADALALLLLGLERMEGAR